MSVSERGVLCPAEQVTDQLKPCSLKRVSTLQPFIHNCIQNNGCVEQIVEKMSVLGYDLCVLSVYCLCVCVCGVHACACEYVYL